MRKRLATKRERELQQAKENYEAVRRFQGNTELQTVDRNKIWLEDLLNKAEAIETCYGLKPGELDPGPPKGKTNTLQIQRDKDLARAKELRQAVADFEKNNDQSAIDRNRGWLESTLEQAEALETQHGVQSPTPTTANGSMVLRGIYSTGLLPISRRQSCEE